MALREWQCAGPTPPAPIVHRSRARRPCLAMPSWLLSCPPRFWPPATGLWPANTPRSGPGAPRRSWHRWKRTLLSSWAGWACEARREPSSPGAHRTNRCSWLWQSSRRRRLTVSGRRFCQSRPTPMNAARGSGARSSGFPAPQPPHPRHWRPYGSRPTPPIPCSLCLQQSHAWTGSVPGCPPCHQFGQQRRATSCRRPVLRPWAGWLPWPSEPCATRLRLSTCLMHAGGRLRNYSRRRLPAARTTGV